MRLVRNIQIAHSRHFASVNSNYVQRPLLQHFVRYTRTIMPKRKFRQEATDSSVALDVSEQTTVTSINIPQRRREVQIAKEVTAGSKILRKSFAKPIIDGNSPKYALSDTDSPLSEPPEIENNVGRPTKPKKSKNAEKKIAKNGSVIAEKSDSKSSNGIIPPENLPSEDADSDVDEEFDEAKIQEAFSRPPPVNSSYLPLPWKGRLGYVSC